MQIFKPKLIFPFNWSCSICFVQCLRKGMNLTVMFPGWEECRGSKKNHSRSAFKWSRECWKKIVKTPDRLLRPGKPAAEIQSLVAPPGPRIHLWRWTKKKGSCHLEIHTDSKAITIHFCVCSETSKLSLNSSSTVVRKDRRSRLKIKCFETVDVNFTFSLSTLKFLYSAKLSFSSKSSISMRRSYTSRRAFIS